MNRTRFYASAAAAASLGYATWKAEPAKSQNAPEPVARQAQKITSPVAFVCAAPVLKNFNGNYRLRAPVIPAIKGAEFKQKWEIQGESGFGSYEVTAADNVLTMDMQGRVLLKESGSVADVAHSNFRLSAADENDPYVLTENKIYKVIVDVTGNVVREIKKGQKSFGADGTTEMLFGKYKSELDILNSPLKQHYEAYVGAVEEIANQETKIIAFTQEIPEGEQQIINGHRLTRRFSLRHVFSGVTAGMPEAIKIDSALFGMNASIHSGSVTMSLSNKVTVKIEGKRVVTIFIGGFFDKTIGGPVVSYVDSIKKNKGLEDIEYKPWTPESDIIKLIQTLPKDTTINLIGHSYGGDTAVNVALKCGRSITYLVTIDPVSGSGKTEPPQKSVDPMAQEKFLAPKIVQIGNKVSHWINVNAKIPPKEANASDKFADTGGDWGDLPGKYGASHIISERTHHDEFTRMMRLNGVKGGRIEQVIPGL